MSCSASLCLPTGLGRALLAEARAANGYEICGFIAADTSIYRRYAVTNRAARSSDRFAMDPADQIAAFKRMRQNSQTLRAIYHSHPAGEATPSIHDRQGHNYPETAALIMAPWAQAEAVRAWRLTPDTAVELAIEWQAAPWRDGFL